MEEKGPVGGCRADQPEGQPEDLGAGLSATPSENHLEGAAQHDTGKSLSTRQSLLLMTTNQVFTNGTDGGAAPQET